MPLPDPVFSDYKRRNFQNIRGGHGPEMSREQREEAVQALAAIEFQQDDFRAHLENIYREILTFHDREEQMFHASKRIAALTAKAADTAKKGAEKSIELHSRIADLATELHDFVQAQDRTNRRVTCWMVLLTVLGVVFAAAALVVGILSYLGDEQERRKETHVLSNIQPTKDTSLIPPSIEQSPVGVSSPPAPNTLPEPPPGD